MSFIPFNLDLMLLTVIYIKLLDIHSIKLIKFNIHFPLWFISLQYIHYQSVHLFDNKIIFPLFIWTAN